MMKLPDRSSVIAFLLIVVTGTLLYNKQQIAAYMMDVRTEIARSITSGDVEKFDSLVSKYPNLSYADFRYRRNMNLAQFLNYERTKPIFVEKLISLGVDINHMDDDGSTPLKSALNGNNPKIVKALLLNGASISKKKPDGLSAVEFCISAAKQLPDTPGCILVYQQAEK